MAASGPGPPSDGVVRNSALSFVAPAQVLSGGVSPGNQDAEEQSNNQAERLVPAGLKALCDACSKMYPDQPNPLQVTTRVKYWLGGEDPLDYISMYWNPGISEEQVPPHWHYVSFGLSDLHGDGRVHPAPSTSPAAPSGFGLELTLRLAGSGAPPLWPAALLQALARYMFSTGNKFCAGDHISWHAPLAAGASRVRHLLVADDARLPRVHTPHGSVAFLQAGQGSQSNYRHARHNSLVLRVTTHQRLLQQLLLSWATVIAYHQLVGCTARELRAAQRSSGFEVLKLIQEDTSCGGSWLVTHVSRRRSARRVLATCKVQSPAHLAGVSARLHALPWTESEHQPAPTASLTPRVEQEIKETLQRGLSTMSTDRSLPEVTGHMSTDSFEMSSIEKALPQIPELMQASWRGEDSIEYLDGVHLIMNPEGASLLPLAIDGRVLHGRHFTWRDGPRAVTLLSPAVAGAFATPAQPYASRGSWLQIVITKELARAMSAEVAPLGRLGEPDSESEGGGPAPPPLPLALSWPKHRLKITVVYDQLL